MKIRELLENSLASAVGTALGKGIKSGADDVAKVGSRSEPAAGEKARTKVVPIVKADAKEKEKEQDTEEVAIIFGRFNPPHVGHKEAWIKASQSPVWYLGTNQATIGPTDPLPFDVKVECIKAIWPGTEGHIVAEHDWWALASYVFKKHGPVNLYVVTDDKDAKIFVPGLQKSNGVQGPHGFYHFKKIEWRKADRLSSATDLRAAVIEGSRQKFTKAAGVSSETPVMGKPFFDLVSEYLLPYKDQILASIARKAAKAAKAAKNEGQVSETKRMSNAVKLQRAWEREQARSAASRRRGEEVMAQAKKHHDDDWYDRHGNVDPRGAYDAGGHYHMDRDMEEGWFDSKPKVDFKVRAKELFAKGLSEQQVYQQLIKEGCPPNQAAVFVQAAQINEEERTFADILKNELLKEFTKSVTEGSAGKVGKGGTKTIDKEKKAAMKNAATLPGLNMATGSMYKNYRMGIALAGAPTYPTKIEADNWIGGDPLISSYTEEEYEMVKAAALQVGAGTIQNWSGNRSKEVADVNKKSTVAKIKRNKYGI